MPKVSVVIPTYNRDKYIRRAVDSVLAQTFTDYEIIVVDDGSSDHTAEILAGYGDKIKYIYQKNQGIAGARNTGIRASVGDYIAFLDSDDYWVPDKLTKQVMVIEVNKKVGIVFCRMPIVDEEGRVIGRKPSGICGMNFRELIEVWGDFPTSTVMIRRECFDKVGLFDPDLPPMEDIDMWLRISRHYDIFEVKNDVLAYYKRHEEQSTRSRRKVYEGLTKLNYKILRMYSDIPRGLVLRRAVFNQYLLARVYFHEKSFRKALANALESILRYPLLGHLFFMEKDSLGVKFVKLFKPYGFLTVLCLRALRSWLGRLGQVEFNATRGTTS